MIALITISIVLITLFAFGKYFFRKKLQREYERSLLDGDEEKATLLGRSYYHAISSGTKKAKGIEDIERKISDDFRAFNGMCFV